MLPAMAGGGREDGRASGFIGKTAVVFLQGHKVRMLRVQGVLLLLLPSWTSVDYVVLELV